MITARLASLRSRPFWGRTTLVDRVVESLVPTGANVLLVGVGGVGKTSLAIAGLRRLVERDPEVRIVHLTATESSAATPLAVFEPLLRAAGEADGQGESPDRIGQALIRACLADAAPAYGSSAARASQLVIHLDDVSLLDRMSLTVLDYLVSRIDVRMILTCRSVPGPPAGLVRAHRDGVLARIDVPELSPAETAEFAAECLPDKRIAPETLQRIHQITNGNALFLTELLRALDASSAFEDRQGMWVWTAPLPVGTSLTDLLRVELEQLTDEQRSAFEVVALCAPVPMDLLGPAVTVETLSALEADGLVELSQPPHSATPLIGLTHPLYGEAITALLTPTQVLARYRALFESAVDRYTSELDDGGGAAIASAARATGDEAAALAWSGETSELLAVVGWGLRGGCPVPLPLLVAAFRYGRSLGDPDFRIRIATAILRRTDAAPSLRAAVLVNRAEAHRHSNRPDAASDDVDRARETIASLSDPAERITLAISLAHIATDLFIMVQGRDEAALRLLDWAQDLITASASVIAGAPPVDVTTAALGLDALRVRCLSYSGDMLEAGDLVARIRSRARGTGELLPLVSVYVLMLAQRGEAKQARSFARGQFAQAVTTITESPFMAGEVIGSWGLAGVIGGTTREAMFLLRLISTAASRNPGKVRMHGSILGFGRGLVAIAGGEWDEAVEHLAVACAELQDFTGSGSEGYLLASLTLAYAMTGDHAAAARTRAEIPRLSVPPSPLVEAPTRLSLLQAAMTVPTGTEAAEARAIADLCRGFGFELMELRALHLLAVTERALDAADRERVADLAARLDAPIAAPLGDSVSHVLAGGTPNIGDAARALARRGLTIPVPAHPTLTQREQQLAELFALGYTNAQVAKRLHISKRTIETHTARIYQKLRVSSRDDIADALDAD